MAQSTLLAALAAGGVMFAAGSMITVAMLKNSLAPVAQAAYVNTSGHIGDKHPESVSALDMVFLRKELEKIVYEPLIKDFYNPPQVSRRVSTLENTILIPSSQTPQYLSVLAQRQAEVRAKNAAQDAQSQETFKRLLEVANNSASLNQLQGSAEILAAVQRGQLQAPSGSIDEDGNVDVRTVLYGLVEKAVSEGGSYADEAENPAAIPIRVITQDTEYVVEAGDSLAYISLIHYGRTDAFGTIFQANRDKLNSPNEIQIGQRLKIPAI